MDNKAHSLDYETLLQHAKNGFRLPEEVLCRIRQQLASGDFESDPYTLIHILGKCGDRESQPLVMRYLGFGLGSPGDDGMVRRIALQVLGAMWEVPQAFEIAADKAFNDPSPFVRAVAPPIIGTLAARSPTLKSRAAALLTRGFDQRATEDPMVWESFHEGLLDLFDVPLSERPLPTRELTEQDVRWDIAAEARKLATANK